MPRQRSKAGLLIWTLLAVFAVPGAIAQDPPKVAKIKSAFLLNFVKFTQWPKKAFANKTAPVRVCVLGKDPLGKTLNTTMARTTVGGRSIEVTRLRRPTRSVGQSLQDFQNKTKAFEKQLDGFHMIYAAPSESAHAADLAKRYRSTGVLVVGDGKHFAEAGNVLALNLERGRIVFYASKQALKTTKFKISSQVLRLARLIDDTKKAGN
jgi:hypothetical protein